ncbi:MAG: hypothetical protein J6P03_03300 [Opitutales bacterium]|nr:hypothetical protein [Opitutales bacterium]
MNRLFQLAMIALAGLFIFCAASVRIRNLEDRAPHADESEQAFTAARLVQDGEYSYNPRGPHGPILYYWAASVLSGKDACDIDMPLLRKTLLPVFFATLALLFAAPLYSKNEKSLYQNRCRGLVEARFGQSAKFAFAAAAVGFLCASSLSSIYSTYFVHECFFAFFGLGLCLTGERFFKSPTLVNSAALGTLAGMLQTAKETSVIAFASLIAAWIVCDVSSSEYRAKLARFLKTRGAVGILKTALCAAGAAAFVYTVFYSSFGANPDGILDGVKSYFIHFFGKSESAAHAKGFFYYFKLLAGFKSQGAVFGESAIFALSICGGVCAFALKNRLVKYAFTFGLANVLIMSAIAYKTPWLLLLPTTALCLPAGYAVSVMLFSRLKNRGVFANAAASAAGMILIFLLASLQIKEQKNAAVFYKCDPRNPMIYVHTLKSEEALVKRIYDCAKVADESFRVLVLTKNSPWPLPWQLLKLNAADFKSGVDNSDDLSKYSIVVFDAPFDEFFKDKLPPDKFLEEYFGLRENLLLRARVRRDIFEKSIR